MGYRARTATLLSTTALGATVLVSGCSPNQATTTYFQPGVQAAEKDRYRRQAHAAQKGFKIHYKDTARKDVRCDFAGQLRPVPSGSLNAVASYEAEGGVVSEPVLLVKKPAGVHEGFGWLQKAAPYKTTIQYDQQQRDGTIEGKQAPALILDNKDGVPIAGLVTSEFYHVLRRHGCQEIGTVTLQRDEGLAREPTGISLPAENPFSRTYNIPNPDQARPGDEKLTPTPAEHVTFVPYKGEIVFCSDGQKVAFDTKGNNLVPARLNGEPILLAQIPDADYDIAQLTSGLDRTELSGVGVGSAVDLPDKVPDALAKSAVALDWGVLSLEDACSDPSMAAHFQNGKAVPFSDSSHLERTLN